MTKKTDIAKELLDYLANRPNREDTLDEITEWFVRMDKGAYAKDALNAALNILVEKGDLEEIKLQKDFFAYRVKKGQRV
jgi:hypothetical protein